MSEQYNIISIDTLNNLNENINQNTSNIASAKTELNDNIASAKTELNNNINSVKTELNNNINSVLSNKVFNCQRIYSSSKELDLYNICTFNVGEMGIYALGTSSGSIKLTISNQNMGVTYLAMGFNSKGALVQSKMGDMKKASGSTSISTSINNSTVSEIYVIAVRKE